MLSIQEIKELIEALDKSSITDFTLTDENNVMLEMKKNTSSVQSASSIFQTTVSVPANQEAVSSPPPTKTIVAQVSSEETISAPFTAKKEENLIDITSPMVGTFYASSSPDASAYVTIGSKVTKKSVVCIVEAMKLFNEIEAECDGEIAEILVEKGQLVEYGQVLFRVRPSK